jgi:hypothetical protein
MKLNRLKQRDGFGDAKYQKDKGKIREGKVYSGE